MRGSSLSWSAAKKANLKSAMSGVSVSSTLAASLSSKIQSGTDEIVGTDWPCAEIETSCARFKRGR